VGQDPVLHVQEHLQAQAALKAAAGAAAVKLVCSQGMSELALLLLCYWINPCLIALSGAKPGS
jgi:hypothetical protein